MAVWPLLLEPKQGEESFCTVWQGVWKPSWVEKVFVKGRGAVMAAQNGM